MCHTWGKIKGYCRGEPSFRPRSFPYALPKRRAIARSPKRAPDAVLKHMENPGSWYPCDINWGRIWHPCNIFPQKNAKGGFAVGLREGLICSRQLWKKAGPWNLTPPPTTSPLPHITHTLEAASAPPNAHADTRAKIPSLLQGFNSLLEWFYII